MTQPHTLLYPFPLLTWYELGERAQRSIIGHVARREEQSGVFLMQLGQLSFQLLVVRRVARDVASAARTSAMLVQRLPKQAAKHSRKCLARYCTCT